MRKQILFAALVLLFFVLPVLAKRPPEKVVIKGPKLDQEIVVSDPQLLQQLNPWRAWFTGDKDPAPTPASGEHLYEVFLYIHWPRGHSAYDRDGLSLFYHVIYAPGREGERGRIFYPGNDDKYHVNSGTILRDGIDGTWQWANSEFDETMRKVNITKAG